MHKIQEQDIMLQRFKIITERRGGFSQPLDVYEVRKEVPKPQLLSMKIGL